MIRMAYEITRTLYDLARATSPLNIIGEDVKKAGISDAIVQEVDGRYYLVYYRGKEARHER